MFFLGAGASVDAGLPDVVRLVCKFVEWLKSISENQGLNEKQRSEAKEHLSLVEKILTILKNWRAEQKNYNTEIDIEILLDAIERIENKNTDILSAFYENTSLKIGEHPAYNLVFNGKRKISGEIKDFIKTTFSNTRINVTYLKPLNNFIRGYRGLSIFSTNYDLCIEQFCKENGRTFVDGFNPYWNPEIEYGKKDSPDIQLYKLHGSITWYRSEGGEYTRSDIIVSDERSIIVGGQEVVPLILYPGRKLEYIEPVIYMLAEIKKQLEEVNYVFVVGYSFKDGHLAKLFRYAAARNRKLILFLIGPSAYNTYDKKLRHLEDELFPKHFTGGFTHTGFSSTPIPSYLDGRVICLNYKFKKVFPLLRNHYLRNLKEAQIIENKIEYGDTASESEWKRCLRHYIDCEYIEKAEKMMKEMTWYESTSKDLVFWLEICFKGLISSVLCNDNTVKTKWIGYFEKVCQLFSVDKFVVEAEASTTYSSIPPKITMKIPNGLVDCLQDTIIPFMENTMTIISNNKSVNEFIDRIRKLGEYLHLWQKSGDMTYERYFELRSDKYNDKIKELKEKVSIYKQKQNSTEEQPVENIIMQIERKELQKIFGGDILEFDIPK